MACSRALGFNTSAVTLGLEWYLLKFLRTAQWESGEAARRLWQDPSLGSWVFVDIKLNQDWQDRQSDQNL